MKTKKKLTYCSIKNYNLSLLKLFCFPLILLLFFACSHEVVSPVTNKSEGDESFLKPNDLSGKGKKDDKLQFAKRWIAFLIWEPDKDVVIDEFSTEWTVPESPSMQSDQVIYFVSGLTNGSIIQPVLQWGNTKTKIGGGNYWAVAAWDVESAYGPVQFSPLLKVKPGDVCQTKIIYNGFDGKFHKYECKVIVNEPLKRLCI